MEMWVIIYIVDFLGNLTSRDGTYILCVLEMTACHHLVGIDIYGWKSSREVNSDPSFFMELNRDMAMPCMNVLDCGTCNTPLWIDRVKLPVDRYCSIVFILLRKCGSSVAD